MKKPKRSNIPRGKRKRLTVRLPMVVWRQVQEVARNAGMEVNALIEAILKSWNGRTPPVNR